MQGILADINALGYVEVLVGHMQAPDWAEFWAVLGLILKCFEDVGLSPNSTDLEIWRICQAEQLILITDNRNLDGPDSLEATIRQHNQPDCLPVFTIADLNAFRTSPLYIERVVESFYEYLLRIDEVRGTGRLYLP